MILVLGLLFCNVGFAEEIILDCYKWGLEEIRDTAEMRADLKLDKIDSEIDLKKKILHFDGNKFDIESETQRKIVALTCRDLPARKGCHKTFCLFFSR